MPLGYALTFNNPAVNWMYNTQPVAALNERSCFWPRGKVVGGSSSINAMVYMRGLPYDFDAWRDQGCEGWGWEDVLRYYKKSEDHQLYNNEHHNQGGELHITDIGNDVHPLTDVFIEAGQAAGYPVTLDFNGAQKEGFGKYQLTSKNGYRGSSSNAFLKPAKNRKNLTVETNAHATRILFGSEDDADSATGIEYVQKSQKYTVTANKEVIISGGSINSPQLLQLSGIGDAQLLAKHNIDVVHDLPSVGQNLLDHLCHTHYYKSKVPTLNDDLHSWLDKLKVGLRYALTRKGLLSMSVNQAGALVKSNPEMQWPDFQLYFNPLTYALNGEVRKVLNTDPFSAFSVTFNACRPTSRGSITIQSADPLEKPLIEPNYLSTKKDQLDAIMGNKILRQISQSEPLAKVIENEILPGPEVQTDEQFLADFRARAGTIYHPSGSCKMGPSPDSSVVDSRLRVHGVRNLRVVDASIFPTIPSANTNAPSMMVGEKGAAHILQDRELLR